MKSTPSKLVSPLAAALAALALVLSGCAPESATSHGPGGTPSEQTEAPNHSDASNPARTSHSWSSSTEQFSGASSEVRALTLNLSSNTTISPQARVLLARSVLNACVRDGQTHSYSGTQAYHHFVSQNAHDDSSPASASLSRIQNEYLQVRRETEVGHAILATNQTIIEGSLTAGTAMATASGGVMAGVAFGAFSSEMSTLLNKVMETYDESALNAAQSVLGSKLSSMPEAAWGEWDALSNLPPEEARQRGRELVNSWSSTLLKDIEGAEQPAARSIFNGYLVQALTGQLAREGSLRALADRHQGQAIEVNTRQIVAIGNTLNSFIERTHQQLQDIKQNQRTLNDGLAEMSEIHHELGFVQEFIFGRMSPQEQLSSLERGMFPGMPDNKRDELTAKIQLVQQRAELITQLGDFFNGAQTLVQVGRGMGVNPDLLRTAQTIVTAGSAVQQVFTAFASNSGYLGAATAVLKLFGFGGPDIATQRHDQIMGHLNSLLEGQRAILDSQERIFEAQKVLIQGQRHIYDSIVLLSSQVQESHRLMMEGMERVRGDVIFNRELIRSVLLRDTHMCQNFLSTRSEFGGFNPESKQFESYDGVSAHFSNYTRQFFSCIDGLEQTIGNPELSRASLALRTHENSENNPNIGLYISRVYMPTWTYLKSKYVASNQPLSNLYNGLAIPSATSVHIEVKRAEIARIRPAEPLYPVEQLGTPSSPDALIKYAGYLLDVLPYFDLITFSGNGGLREFNELLNSSTPGSRSKGRVLLMQTMKLVDLAIAQESIVSGDLALGYLYNEFDKAMETSIECAPPNESHPSCLLKNNPLLATNFVLNGIREDLAATGSNRIAYAIALEMQGSPSILKRVTRKNWEFHWSAQASPENAPVSIPQGWSVKIGSKHYALPTPEQLLEDRLTYRSDMQKLLEFKARLSEAWALVVIENRLPTADRRQFAHFLLRGI